MCGVRPTNDVLGKGKIMGIPPWTVGKSLPVTISGFCHGITLREVPSAFLMSHVIRRAPSNGFIIKVEPPASKR